MYEEVEAIIRAEYTEGDPATSIQWATVGEAMLEELRENSNPGGDFAETTFAPHISSTAHRKLSEIFERKFQTSMPTISKLACNKAEKAITRAFYRSVNELVRLRQISPWRAAALVQSFATDLNVPEKVLHRLPLLDVSDADNTWVDTLKKLWTHYGAARNPLQYRHMVKVEPLDVPKQPTVREIQGSRGIEQIRELLGRLKINKEDIQLASRGEASVEIVVSY